MSEPLVERLSRFTPDSSGLDRDALLFAAGRAAVRPAHRWMVLAGALAACQVLTLVSLWPRTPTASVAVPEPFVVAVPETPPVIHDPSELGVLRERLLASESDWPTPIDEGPTIAPAPPLRAFGVADSTILN